MRIGVVGLGNVGRTLVRRLAGGVVPGATLAAVSHSRPEEAVAHLEELGSKAAVRDLEGLVNEVDVVVETATADALPRIAERTVSAGKTLVCVSAAGLLEAGEAMQRAADGQGKVIIANGMMPGLDIIRAAREGRILSVTLTTTLRPASLVDEPYIARMSIRLPGSDDEPIRIFRGSAREVAREFPRHFNVAVALSLAGAGLDDTVVEVWADPAATGSKHRVQLQSDAVALDLTAAGYPSDDNPRTSMLVPDSVLATLRRMTDGVQVGG